MEMSLSYRLESTRLDGLGVSERLERLYRNPTVTVDLTSSSSSTGGAQAHDSECTIAVLDVIDGLSCSLKAGLGTLYALTCV